MKKNFTKETYINHKDIQLRNALQYAIVIGSAKIVKLLIDHGANVDHEDHYAPPILYLEIDQLEKIKILIEANCDTTVIFEDGTNLLTNFIAEYCRNFLIYEPGERYENFQTIKYLIKTNKFDLDLKDNHGHSSLFVTIICCYDIGLIKLIVDHCKNVNITDNKGNTVVYRLLMPYCNRYTIHIFKHLLRKGLDLSIKNSNGISMLKYIESIKFSKELTQKYFDIVIKIEKMKNIKLIYQCCYYIQKNIDKFNEENILQLNRDIKKTLERYNIFY